MSKRLFYILLLFLVALSTKAQEKQVLEGRVSYINIENVYIKFSTTTNLKSNDTLEVFLQGAWKKVLLVNAISSTSCVAKNISNETITINTLVRFVFKMAVNPAKLVEKKELPVVAPPTTGIPNTATTSDSLKRKQTFDGRVYMSAFGSLDGVQNSFNQLRTSMSFTINNIHGSKFSFENYINYRPRFGAQTTTNTFADDFKVYSFALSYDATPNTTIAFGRKNNNRMANMGAIDGLQVEHRYKHFVFGAFGGFAPDYNDYGFNASLLQYGGFAAHEINNNIGQMQSSFAFAEQRNSGNTDRRFLYLQHSNTLLKNVSLFYSLELDLFQNINGVITNKINLTSTYISLRYRPFRQLNFTVSYDNRRNVIYYETYKTFLEQLINQETRQGVRLQINHNLTKFMTINLSAFYRYQESRPEPTKNYVANFTIAQVLGNGSYLNFNLNRMDTYYFYGDIYGVRLNKDLFKSTVSTELSFRKVSYLFFNENQPNLQQNIVGASLNFYGRKRPSVMLSYEGTFEPNASYNRYFVTISQRFKSKTK
ncbi:MAG: hypothetical protein U0Y10_21595 [Spirosomataceae bacterium]